MSIKYRLILSNIALITLILFFSVINFFVVQDIYFGKIQSSYNLDFKGRGSVVNQVFEMKRFDSKNFDKFKNIVQDDAEKFQDKSLLEKLNNEYKVENSFIVVAKEGELYFEGEKNIISKIPRLLEDWHKDKGLDKLLNEDNQNTNYQIRPMFFTFSDGEEGTLFFITDVSDLKNMFKGFIITIIITTILIVIIISTLLNFLMSRSILNPIKELKKATKKIEDGNLDFEFFFKSKDEIGELCEAFNDMRLKIRESNRVKAQYENNRTELIANISHDLKTPITTIKGYVEGIRDGVAATPDKIEKYMGIIHTKVISMDKLIDELFLFSKLDTNSISFKFEKVNIKSYVDDWADELYFQLEKMDIKFQYKNNLISNPLSLLDREKLNRVKTNIIDNSIKHMDKEEKSISMILDENDEGLIISIKDNGKGISSKALPHIFERFYREDMARNTVYGGSGLGLAISKKIIDEHNGKIFATSENGEGTTISILLKKYKEGDEDEKNINN